MTFRKSLFATALAVLPGTALADDYFGTLKPPQSSLSRPGLYSFTTGSTFDAPTPFAADGGYRLKLGYKYSRYFAVEGEYVDFGRSAAELFASPGNLAPSFRSTGFGIDTIAMLPLWRFSFYGRMGAYRGDSRGGFGFVSTSLLPADNFARSTRMRYGMGVRYDFNKALGIRAELERTSAVGSPFAADVDTTDQVSVGLSWRF